MGPCLEPQSEVELEDDEEAEKGSNSKANKKNTLECNLFGMRRGPGTVFCPDLATGKFDSPVQFTVLHGKLACTGMAEREERMETV
ncbi:hypothetical protein WISP_33072 [Willisornis vidua]|uniref:Uncharacterized protein n=1 Tax=Willisornis vidua TaxID=1566151 RepID=A0ABQ9DQD2_9PASS|nr:hypothetical protein WISP_33072 [Willisornis vidua]